MYQTLLKPAFADIKTFILDTLFPISCLACEKEGGFTHHHFSSKESAQDKQTQSIETVKIENTPSKNGDGFICDDCRGTLTKLENQKCIVCHKAAIFGLTHSGCLTPHAADGLISFYDYHDEKVAKIIIQGKYYFLPDVYKILGKIIAEQIKSNFPYLLQATSYNLTPIPLHPLRKRWRGFNQAEILCRSLSVELNLPVANVLIRKKITKTQKDLNKEERLKNMDGAFAISTKLPSPKALHYNLLPLGEGGPDKSGPDEGLEDRLNFTDDPIKNKNFILVDDVTTTGATLFEAAKVLKRNGAKKVICLTIARD